MNKTPRLLLLGDSIRMGYQPLVAEALSGRMAVVGPEENGMSAAYTLASLPRWLDELGRPDLVHWNNGIHDLGYCETREVVHYEIDAYLANLRAILARLRETGAPIVWATTTPVLVSGDLLPGTHPPRHKGHYEGWSWVEGDVERYNAAACRLMESEGIPINDLCAVIGADIDRYIVPDLMHLSDEGNKAAAEAVVRCVEGMM
jgi:lysophospholipase L1-like esterase